jgi:hypothetical protein
MSKFQYSIKESSAIYRWTFNHMLPGLPVPGTNHFFELLKQLGKYRIAPADVSVEAPSQRLSDVALTILLFNQRVTIKVTYAYVELTVNRLFADDSPLLLDIGQAIFRVLGLIDSIDLSGHVSVIVRAHLNIGTDVDKFLSQQLLNEHAGEVKLDAMLCRFPLRKKEIEEIRVLIARSMIYPPDSLFVDATVTYGPEVDINELSGRVDNDWDDMLSTFGLFPNT